MQRYPIPNMQGAFLILAIWPWLLAAQRTSCPKPNQFLEGGVCKICPAGTFLDTTTGACRPCRPGQFRATPGAFSSFQCIFCPNGTFQDEEGSASCKPCPPGTISGIERFRVTCVSSCAPGQDHFLTPFCSNCSTNFFKPTAGLDFCQPCPDGTETKGTGAKRCVKCPPGQFRASKPRDLLRINDERTKCIDCQKGTFSDVAGTKFCKLCPLGSVSSQGSTSCIPCPPGTFSKRLLSSKCRTCPPGTVADKPGSAGCKKADKCPANTFEDANGVCKMCHAGDRFDITLKKCIRCGDNEISFGGIDTECTACPAGMQPVGASSILERSACVCKPGLVLESFLGVPVGCTPCPAGTYWINDRTFLFDRGLRRRRRPELDLDGFCSACFEGEFSDSPGSLSCTKCPENTFSRRSRSATCEPCPSGFGNAVSFRRNKCVDKEQVCQPGQIRVLKKKVRKCPFRTCCRAKTCLPGFFLPSRKAECINCDVGFRYDPGSNRCFACTGDTISMGGLDETCKPCSNFLPNSEFFFLSEIKRCICREGFGGPLCEACEPERVWVRLENGDAKCFRCPAGTEFKEGRCEKCPKGQISSEGNPCVKCPSGTKQVIDVLGEPRNACLPRM